MKIRRYVIKRNDSAFWDVMEVVDNGEPRLLQGGIDNEIIARQLAMYPEVQDRVTELMTQLRSVRSIVNNII